MKRFRAPGRVNLIGEHTDYTGGLVLPVALDRAVTIACEPAEHTVLESPIGGFEPYVAAVAFELDALGRRPAGIAGSISSDLPVGAGLSSSAALEVAVALALCDAAAFELAPAELIRACQRAELRAVGVPCGPMDQAVSLLGRAGHALLLDCSDLSYEHIALPPGLGILVIDSGTRRNLADTAYAVRRQEIERGLAGARDTVALKRMRHLETENARVIEAAGALRRGDGAALGPILSAGHASLRDDLEVSTPQLDLLVALALEHGAWGARMTGGGFGGAIVAVAPVGITDQLGADVAAAYLGRTGIPAVPLRYNSDWHD